MGRLIERIAYKDSRVELGYTETNETSTNGYTIDSAEQPLKTFGEALQALKAYVLDVLELPNEYGKGMVISAVHFTHKNDIMAVVVVARKKIVSANSPFNIITPVLPETPYNPKDKDGPRLPSTCVKALERLMEEADKYIDGKRLQIEMSKN